MKRRKLVIEDKKHGTLTNLYLEYIPYILAFLISLILGPLLYCLSFYVHEAGHIIYGFLDNLVSRGLIAKFTISNWIECPLIKSLKLPQQTKILYGYTSLNYYYGGIVLTLLVSSIICYYYTRCSKNKHKLVIFLFPLLFALEEVLGNFLCGTDNVHGIPYPVCASSAIINILIKAVPYLLSIPFYILLVPFVENKKAQYIAHLIAYQNKTDNGGKENENKKE